MERNYIQYAELLKRKEDLKSLERRGVKLLYSKNRFKVVCGVVCLSVAIFPNGLGVVFYPLGFYLLGFNKIDLKQYYEGVLKRIRGFIFIQMKGGLKK